MEVDISEFMEIELDASRREMFTREKSLFFAKLHPKAIFPIFGKKCKDCQCARCVGSLEIQVLPVQCVMRKAVEKWMKKHSIRFIQVEVKQDQHVRHLKNKTRFMKKYFDVPYVVNDNFDVIWVDDYMSSPPKSHILYGGWVKNSNIWSWVPQKLIHLFRDIQKLKKVFDPVTEKVLFAKASYPVEIQDLQTRTDLVEGGLFAHFFSNEIVQNVLAEITSTCNPNRFDLDVLAGFSGLRFHDNETLVNSDIRMLPDVKLDSQFGVIKYIDLPDVDIAWIIDNSTAVVKFQVFYGSWVSQGLHTQLVPVRRLIEFFTLINEMEPRFFAGIRDAFAAKEYDCVSN